MKSKELEILPCRGCEAVPLFLPWPSEEFPTLHFPVCQCKHKTADVSLDIAINDYEYRNRNKQSVVRKANKRSAIIRWNSNVDRFVKRKLGDGLVTCKFCKRADLIWGKRPYKSAWNGKKMDYVLYERVELPEVEEPGLIINGISIGGHRIKPIKHVIHNCLSRKNIVSVAYTKD